VLAIPPIQTFEEFEAETMAMLTPPFESKFGGLLFREFDSYQGPEHEWLVDDLLSRQDRSLVYGESQSGKSFLAIEFAMCVARGVAFMERKVRQGGVVYQAGEGARGIMNRFRAYRRHHGIDAGEDVPLALLRNPVDLYHPDGDTANLIAEIHGWRRQLSHPLELIVIDTLSTATAGADENSAKDMSAVLANIARVSKECGAHVMLVHHKPKNGDKPRGHSSIFANIDNAIEVARNAETKVRTLHVTKQKDGESGAQIRFRLNVVELGHRDDGKEINSCVVVPIKEELPLGETDRFTKPFTARDSEKRFMEALFNAVETVGQVPAPGLGAPPSVQRVVEYEAVRIEFTKLSLNETDDPKKVADTNRKALKRASEFLLSARVIGAREQFVWWAGRTVLGVPRTYPPKKQKAETASGEVDKDDALPF
jgi:KaiC/GvpD/RAD55 family RecA-like ATPase